MKTLYRIYRYDTHNNPIKIPRQLHKRNGCYTAGEVWRIIDQHDWKGNCDLHNDVIYETEDKVEAEAKLATLTPYSELRNGDDALEITCYGVEEIKCETDEDGEVIDEEFLGGNWVCASVEEEEEEEEEEED